jgi:hypothetical protein
VSHQGCGIAECSRKHYARGWCKLHYNRWARHGDPTVCLTNLGMPVLDRFWSLVDKDGPLPECRPDLGPCWLWMAGLSEGYGRFALMAQVSIKAHRFAYEITYGPVPEGLEPDHLCRVRACVRPDHLEPVTHRVNVWRGDAPTGVNARLIRCRQGHEFTPENTYVDPRGHRVCRTCMRAHRQRWEAAHLEQRSARRR